MEQVITGYHQDEAGDWVAELACGHDQHVRHRPPFEQRPWVLSEQGRAERIAMPLSCPLCDRGELPGVKTTDVPGDGDAEPDEGGDPACWAGVLCPECGIVLDGSAHLRGCSLGYPD